MQTQPEFVRLAHKDRASRRGLCRRLGVSPTTKYARIQRFAAGGIRVLDPALGDRSSVPCQALHKKQAVVAMRIEHDHWGRCMLSGALGKDGIAPTTPATVMRIFYG
ncbi:hypothetical protein D3C71_814700 [compost metagenome]